MRVTITGRHVEVTDAIKEYAERGLEKIRAHFDKVIDVDIILGVEKHRHLVEINLHVNGQHLNAKESSEDMYTSIDSALVKIDRQISKYKGRIQRHQPRSAREARVVEEEAEEFTAEDAV